MLRALVDVKGNPLILSSGEDLSTGLVGCQHHQIHGYMPASAFELVRNIVLTRAKTVAKPPATKPK